MEVEFPNLCQSIRNVVHFVLRMHIQDIYFGTRVWSTRTFNELLQYILKNFTIQLETPINHFRSKYPVCASIIRSGHYFGYRLLVYTELKNSQKYKSSVSLMKISDLAYALISAATKGANVASIIRSEDTLLQLLTEEKTGDQKNERFVQDFKTLADVLIQEMVRHDLDQKFPGLGENLYGEESSKFTNAIGETINVQIKPSQQENYELLCQVLHGNTHAANLLAKVLNSNPEPPPDPKLDQITKEIELSKIRIWIDPIDSTAQYIQGQNGISDENGVVHEGLECVTVLIGVYQIDTGLPIVGVVFQPFHHQQGDSWNSRCLWGICYDDIKIHSNVAQNESSSSTKQENGLIITSSSEEKNIQKKLEKEFRLCYAAGAGYKTLCVLDHTADAYLLSKGSTYHWDICAPHAILLAMGGGVIPFKTALENPNGDSTQLQIHYHLPKDDASTGINQWCNSDGVIAYRDSTILKKICDNIR